MSKRFASTHHAINLLRNGNFELAEDVQGNTLPAFWDIQGAVPDEFGNSDTITSFKVEQDQPIVAGGSDNFLSVIMQDTDVVRLQQSFLRDNPLSFSTPLLPNTKRSVPSGYVNATELVLPAYTYTVAVSTQTVQGTVSFEVQAYDMEGELQVLSMLESTNTTVDQPDFFERTSIAFEVPLPISKVELVLTRKVGSGLLKARLAMISMAQGTYSTLPYLPDPFISCFPEGAIILTQGDICPTGFMELGEGDTSPLAEWSSVRADAKGRKGNFPRSADTASGTEQHTADPDFSPAITDTVEFPSETNLEVVEDTFSGNYVNPSADLPGDPSGAPSHEHSLSAAGTRPVSWAFRLCKRL